MVVRKLESDLVCVPRETISLLGKYIDLIIAWNKKINLISRKSLSKEFLEQQILDCAKLIDNLDTKEGFLIYIVKAVELR